MFNRRKTKVITVGDVKVGGDNPISIQSMTNTKTKDTKATIEQINLLTDKGCEVIRVAISDMKDADALIKIKENIRLPLVADIHFDYRLAIKSIENGADKIRINPGNIGSTERVRAVVEKAAEHQIPIRIGVNSGSLEKDILEKFGKVTAEGLSESALRNIKIIEDLGYDNLVVSMKSPSVPLSIEAHKILSASCDYPLHIGITESGTTYAGSIRSAVGIGALLTMGIGDTIRVSLTGDPIEEVRCAKEILASLELRKFGVNFVSCPTCGRTEVDLISIANTVENALKNINKDITVAVMGCVVNGPGEAKDADIGIACGKGSGIIFKKGEILRKVNEEDLAKELLEEIDRL
ncbi:MAG: flavodoxin-dependent (E)-4-hydroxy-3-methylbut-2-enyl-diphosphate synthase [Defluviitaleaceae bacterium]|nr:flavodoxin-dependent (E)-4-hydroxy-3-methylbut-2-enyl-diphosphate synthase [Defluviitaleaceae bacterium]